MLVLVSVAFVVAVLGGALLLVTGVGSVLRDRVLGSGLAVLGAAAGGLVLIGLVALLMVGARGGGDDDGRPGQGSRTSTTGSSPATTVTSRARAADQGSVPGAPTFTDETEPLHVVATDPADSPVPVPVVDGLVDGEVLHIRAEHLRPGARGRVRQCRRAIEGFTACANSFPVQVGPRGTAMFQYQLKLPSEGCRAHDTCVVVVTDYDTTAFAYTVFSEAAPPPARLALAPTGPYRVGQRVGATVDGLPPHAAAGLAFCAPRCEVAVRVVADVTGRARGTVTLKSRCEGPGCTVALVGGGARDTTVAVRFVPTPTPAYEARRVLTGLLGAAVLLLLAWLVARRTDWRPPSEAATPQLDAAEL